MFLEFCARYGFPTPSMNVWIGDHEVDAVFPDHGVAVELDGRDYHTHPTAQERDPTIDVRLQILGYKPMRITYRRLATKPDEVAKDLRDLLAV
jgi:very-short-patch-repair endonuclease